MKARNYSGSSRVFIFLELHVEKEEAQIFQCQNRVLYLFFKYFSVKIDFIFIQCNVIWLFVYKLNDYFLLILKKLVI